MRSLGIFLRGACMGIADVVPGVSGGTIALVLGIYVRFVEALRSITLRWVPGFWRWLRSGFASEHRQAFMEPFLSIHWRFLIPLVAGIMSAILVGARFIPGLLDTYPVEMFSLFFGLVLASVYLPWRTMPTRSWQHLLLIPLVAAATWVVVGTSATPAMSTVEVRAEADMTLEELTTRYLSSLMPFEVYCLRGPNDNAHLRDSAITPAHPDPDAQQLLRREACAALVAAYGDPWLKAIAFEQYHLDRKDPNNLFNALVVPADTPVVLQRPALWYVFGAGLIAICAMLLPGISGSFLLLLLGVYYVVLVSLKGMIASVVAGAPSLLHISYMCAFGLGTLLGLVTFARVLSWLFRRHASATLAVMIGLMLGSLRVIWPFKVGTAALGTVANVIPTMEQLLWAPLLAFLTGFLVVVTLSVVEVRSRDARREREGDLPQI